MGGKELFTHKLFLKTLIYSLDQRFPTVAAKTILQVK